MKSDLDPRFQAILRLVEAYCIDHEDPNVVNKYAHFFKEGYDAFGLTEEQQETLRDKILQEHPLTVEEYAELGWHLFATGKYEYGTIAVMLLKKFRPQFNRVVFDWVRKYFDSGVENWAHSDMLCSNITPVFLELKVADMDDFADWLGSSSKWTRRAVPVTMLALRSSVEPGILLDFLEPLMSDEARVVHQGMGWFLRELWKLHRQPVEDYLFKHRQHAARLIIQYATEKMSPETKQRFRKDKSPKDHRNDRKPGKKPEAQAKKVTKAISPMRRGSEMQTPKPKALHPNKVK